MKYNEDGGNMFAINNVYFIQDILLIQILHNHFCTMYPHLGTLDTLIIPFSLSPRAMRVILLQGWMSFIGMFKSKFSVNSELKAKTVVFRTLGKT
jgi:hypothetical protein